MADGATLRSLSIWTDVEANSGTRESVVQYPLQIDERIEIPEHGGLGREELTAQMPVSDNAWSDVQEGKVLRVELSDGEATEWRIVEVLKKRLSDGSKLGILTCASISYDLVRRTPLIQRVENGRADADFKVIGLTPTEWIDQIILGTPGWPSWINRGTVDASDDLGIFSDFLHAARMLDIICEASPTSDGTPHEWTLRRNGDTDYKIDVLTERGSVNRTPYVALKKSLISADVKSTAREQATRIYPRGGGATGFAAYMGAATWSVDSVSGSTVTLSDPGGGDGPVGFDDQLNGFYLEKANGTTTEITDSDASADTVTVSSATNISASDLIHIRRTSSGEELIYLEEPSAKSTYGLQTKTLDRRDIADVANLVSDVASAFCDTDTDADGVADGWSKVGSPTVTQETTEQYHKHGTASMKVVAADGEGVIVDAMTVAPTRDDPFFVAQAVVRVESGEAQVQLVDATNSENYPEACNDAARWSSDSFTRLDIQPGVNFNDESTTSMRIRVVARGSATFYVDAAQLVQQQTPARSMFDGRGANRLWQAANKELSRRSSPETSYEVEALDLYRKDFDVYSEDQVEPGNTIRINDPGLSEDVEVRVVERRRVITHPDVNKRNELRITVDNTRRRITTRQARQNLPELADENPPQPGADKTEGTPVKDLDGSTETITWSLDANVGGDGTPSVTLTVEDPELRVTGLEFQLKESGSDFSGTWVSTWDSSTGTPGTDTSLSRTENVSVQEKHISAFKARITYEDRACSTITKVLEPVTFDVLIEPIVQITGVGLDTDDTVLIGLLGDQDTAEIYSTWNIGSSPSQPSDPTSGDTALGAGSGILDTGVTASSGDVIWVKARGETSGGVLASTSNIAEAKLKVSEGGLRPVVQVDATQSGSTGKLDLTVTDLQTRVTALEFQKKTGAGDFGGTWLSTWDRSTGAAGTDTTLTRGEDISFGAKHNVAIKWRITYTDADGTSQTTGDTFSFDIDEVAEVNTLSASIDESDGSVVVQAGGDEDTASIRVRVAEGSDPADPDDTVNDDGVISARVGSVDTGVTISTGAVAHVKARGKNSSGSLGPVKEARVTRAPKDPRLTDFSLGVVSDDGTDVDYPVSWTPNSAVNDTDHDLVIECYENGTFVTSSTVNSPSSTTSTTVTDTGGGDGSGTDRSYVKAFLKDTSGNAVGPSYDDASKLQAT